jgi:hypothetical protein
MISPAVESFHESVSTLTFANRAKRIKNEVGRANGTSVIHCPLQAHINEDSNQGAVLRKYAKELKQLKIELDRISQNVVDKGTLLALEEQKKQAGTSNRDCSNPLTLFTYRK